MEIKLASKSKAPYVANRLSKDILRGKFMPGAFLPSDEALARSYKVSRITMRKVLSILTDHGQVVKVPHKGVMVPAGEVKSQDQENDGLGGAVGTQRKILIAAVWAAEPDSNINGFSDGIKQYADEAGMGFQVFLSPNGYARAIEVLENIENYGIRGLLVMPHDSPAFFNAVRRLSEKNFPLVCLGRLVKDTGSSFVSSDDAAGAYRATQYLIETYRRPVYMLRGDFSLQTNVDRYTGYRRAMQDAGYEHLVEASTIEIGVIESDPAYWPTDRKNDPGYDAGLHLFDKVKPAMSVFCNNDYVARGLYLAAQKYGYVIGRDVAVVGFDDMPMARTLNPGLTTIRQEPQQTGYYAGRLLHQLITGKVKSPEWIHLPVSLIVRESA